MKYSYAFLVWAWAAQGALCLMAQETPVTSPVPWSASPLGRWVEMSVVIAVLGAVLWAMWKMMQREAEEKRKFIDKMEKDQAAKDAEQHDREKRMAERISSLEANQRAMSENYFAALTNNTTQLEALNDTLAKSTLQQTENSRRLDSSLCVLLRPDVPRAQLKSVLTQLNVLDHDGRFVERM